MNFTRTELIIVRALRVTTASYVAEHGQLPTRDEFLRLRANWYSPAVFKWVIRLCIACIVAGFTLMILDFGLAYSMLVMFGAGMLGSTWGMSRQTVSQLLATASVPARERIIGAALSTSDQTDH